MQISAHTTLLTFFVACMVSSVPVWAQSKDTGVKAKTYPRMTERVLTTPDREVLAPAIQLDLERQRAVTNSFTNMNRTRKKAMDDAMRQHRERQREAAERERRGRIVTIGKDCDDSRADVHPGATEICDLVDNDCDGVVDEGQTLTVYADVDGDMFGDASKSVEVCPIGANLEHFALNGRDCNDKNPTVNPVMGNCS